MPVIHGLHDVTDVKIVIGLAIAEIDDLVEKADFFKDEILTDMSSLRASCDKLETETAAEYWPFPTYGDLLFAVR